MSVGAVSSWRQEIWNNGRNLAILIQNSDLGLKRRKLRLLHYVQQLQKKKKWFNEKHKIHSEMIYDFSAFKAVPYSAASYSQNINIS